MRKQSGFTLVEIMIVVAIIGILAAVALPAYNRYVLSSNRAVAQTDLLELAQFMERSFTVNSTYPTAASVAATNFTVSPRGATGSDIRYNITRAGDATSYTLTAAPVNAQATDKCQNLTVDSLGITGTSSTETDCWQ